MAASTGTVLSAYDFQQAQQHAYTDTDEYDVMSCKIRVEFSSVDYATADDATFDPSDMIEANGDGRTATVLQACVTGGGCFKLAATPTVQTLCGALGSTVSSNTVTTQLSLEDWSTELTNGTVLSTAVWDYGLEYQITYKVPTVV